MGRERKYNLKAQNVRCKFHGTSLLSATDPCPECEQEVEELTLKAAHQSLTRISLDEELEHIEEYDIDDIRASIRQEYSEVTIGSNLSVDVEPDPEWLYQEGSYGEPDVWSLAYKIHPRCEYGHELIEGEYWYWRNIAPLVVCRACNREWLDQLNEEQYCKYIPIWY